MVTRWRSFISALSNQTWGHDLTMALWMIPIRPPWTWPTWKTHSNVKRNAQTRRFFRKRSHRYHSVAAVVAEDQNVDRRGVIGHTDSSFPGLVFPVSVRKTQPPPPPLGREAVPAPSQVSTGGLYSRVVIAYGGGESSGADPEAHHMDPFAEPRLHPEPEQHTHKHTDAHRWRKPLPLGWKM